jgi:hypothetical protein
MLCTYRRHRADCGFASPHYCRCTCPIYVEGTLGTESIRKSRNQTSWKVASELVSSWTASGEVGWSEVPGLFIVVNVGRDICHTHLTRWYASPDSVQYAAPLKAMVSNG